MVWEGGTGSRLSSHLGSVSKDSFKGCHSENRAPTPVLPVVCCHPSRVTFSSTVVWLYGYAKILWRRGDPREDT